MTHETHRPDPTDMSLHSAVSEACRVIAPAWPLDEQIAVNPLWGLIDKPFGEAGSTLRALTGRDFLPSADLLRQAAQEGQLGDAAISRALQEFSLDATPAEVAERMALPPQRTSRRMLPSDVLSAGEQRTHGPHWGAVITQQISQYCASHFDRLQSDWHRPSDSGLYSGWRQALLRDHALETLKAAPEIRTRADHLPKDAHDALRWALERLTLPWSDAGEFFATSLLRINGWASWCAYLQWQATLRGQTDPNLVELMTIRVCWEALLVSENRREDATLLAWLKVWQANDPSRDDEGSKPFQVCQRALEISYQDQLVRTLSVRPSSQRGDADPKQTDAQWVFCIDVRSERMRRAIELESAQDATLGYAGFFGLPIEYRALGTERSQCHLPGLLLPSLTATETTGSPEGDARVAYERRKQKQHADGLRPFLRSPSGAFALVESVGIGFAGSLLRRHFAATAAERLGNPAIEKDAGVRPVLVERTDGATERHADLCAGILRGMSLTRDFAPWVILVGHGSQSSNNPQAAALDCGACGGRSGEVSARLLADLLNNSRIRAALARRGIVIPPKTIVVAALHNTTTDEVVMHDVLLTDEARAMELQQLRATARRAADRVRRERAVDLGEAVSNTLPGRLLQRLRRRARDWSQTRPEWGLAGNASFIIAPRSRTRELPLSGRSFLHEYLPECDPDGTILEQIMTAPMLVTHWINLQYYASVVEPELFGSGNKVLHNVVGGRIGVFEGNTGDLRIGLSRQSVHDGKRFTHTPLRLSVVIDAPADRIERILERHTSVRHLVDHRWLYLLRYSNNRIEWRSAGRWQPWAPLESGGAKTDLSQASAA